MKKGLFYEGHSLVYYENGQPTHAGVIKINGDIYYISSRGRAVKGRKAVHREMANGLIERGVYTFGDDYKLVEGSYTPVKKRHGYRIKELLHRLKKNRVVNKIFKKKNILPFVAGLLSICFLLVLAKVTQNQTESTQEVISGSNGEVIQENEIIVLPCFDEEVLLCSNAAKQLYDNKCSVSYAVNSGDPYQSFVFPYQFEKTSGTLMLSEEPSYAGAKEYEMRESQENISVDNLKTGTTYYYKVLVNEDVHEGTFRTAPSTRFVSIPGVKNTRDIGGYITKDGNVVKQGFLIRGREIDGLVEHTYFIQREDVERVQDTFGFVYDFDLRADAIFTGVHYQSRLGENVGHKFYDSPVYGGIFSELNLPQVKAIFQDLAKPENYPMYLHCTHGTDRTGTIVFLLQGLLNMSEEDMVREYRLTAFFNHALADSNNMDIIIDGMNAYSGDTLQERIETYFIESVGITEEEIESIRSIFLE